MLKFIVNVLFMASVFVGISIVSFKSMRLAILQTAFILAGTFILVYSYCSKCPATQTECGHPQIGFFRRFVPKRHASPYNLFDTFGLFAYITPTIIFPQFWLWRNWPAFFIFWSLLIIAGILIVTKFCTICPNSYCKMNRCPRYLNIDK